MKPFVKSLVVIDSSNASEVVGVNIGVAVCKRLEDLQLFG
jgi:hypothetical protein